ncbi:MAG: ester cyclase [Polyangiales bacterium]
MATLSKPEIAKAAVTDLDALARTIVDAFNKRDLDRAISVFANDCEYTEIPVGRVFRGPAGMREDLCGWIDSFSDAQMEITNIVYQGDVVCIECVGRGTHSGPFPDQAGGLLAPTGRRIEAPFIDVLNVRNGKVARGRSFWDHGSILRQLVPMQEATTVIRKRDEGTALWMLGGLYEVRVSSKESGGDLCVVTMTLPPGAGAPPHVHSCGEAVTVLEGTLRLHVGDKSSDLGPGDTAYFPKGTLEWFENVSQKPAKMLATYSAGGMDEFFVEAAEPAKKREIPPPSSTPPDVARLTAIAARHGLEIRAK